MQGKSLSEIQTLLFNGQLTVRQLTEHYLSNIAANNHLNAYTEVFKDDVLLAADHLDQKLKQGKEPPGRLFGCVVSVKDLICIKHKRVSAGSRILKGFESKFHAHAIASILKEDAIIIGTTNCDEFGMGSASVNCYYGPVRNAANKDKIAGGSSGGAAVAVQTDTCLIALGTDTGGSVRQPASMCGIAGYKPTYGMVSRSGLIAYASSFDQIGILSHHTDDMDTVMEIISQHDVADATMFQHDLYKDQKPGTVGSESSALRFAYFRQTLDTEKNDPAIALAFQQTIDKLEKNGHMVEGVDFKWLDYLVPCYYILTTAEASSNLSRYDGVRYGYRSPDAHSLQEMYVRSRAEGFGKEVKKRIMLGTFVLSEAYYDAYYTKAQKVRRLIRDDLDKLFARYDFLILPTTPSVAWGVDEQPEDPLQIYFSDVYTVLANLTGTPAISIPSGTNDDNMPFGIQFYADRLMDKKLLNFATAFQKMA